MAFLTKDQLSEFKRMNDALMSSSRQISNLDPKKSFPGQTAKNTEQISKMLIELNAKLDKSSKVQTANLIVASVAACAAVISVILFVV